MKYYVIADVHGFYDEMIAALDQAGFFNDTAPNKLILLGDAFDRGSKPKEIIQFLVNLNRENRLIYVLGNHEDLLTACVQTISSGQFPKSEYFANGTVDTLLNIAEFSFDDTMKFYPEFTRTMLKTDLYRDLLPSAVDFYETENYIFTHGFIPCNIKGFQPITDYTYMENWRNADVTEWKKARWLNPFDAVCKFKVSEKGKTIVCGHWHVNYGHLNYGNKNPNDYSPFFSKELIGLDGNTCYTHTVNCIIIED